MAVIIGTDSISEIQMDYLELARERLPIRELASILYELAHDSDIAEGRENLHPEWVSIFERTKRFLEQSTGPQRFHSVREFFEELDHGQQVIHAINPLEERIVFLLGAGASKPRPSGIPTVTELLPEMLRLARRLDRDQITALADFCDQQGINNIEDLLTAVQISTFCSRNPGIFRLVEFQLFGDDGFGRSGRRRAQGPGRSDVSSVAYVQDTLQVLFGLLSNLMLPASPNKGHEAIVEYLRKNPSTPIVTTNYDCCIDRALVESEVPFTYEIDFANRHVMDILASSSENKASLIKLHGSLNWFYCETCQEVRLVDIEETVKNYNEDRGEYPIISVCNKCGGQRRGLLVPPHAMKFDVAPSLQPLIAAAASAFENKSLIVVVGFSFADADLYISRMVIKAMQEASDTRLLVVDPDPNVVEKVRRKFNAQIPGFDSRTRILTLRGDCSELLPEFLSGGLRTFETTTNTEQHVDAPAEISSGIPELH